MAETINTPEITQNPPVVAPIGTDLTSVEFQFPDTPAIKSCSANVCTNGHEWVPELFLVSCPGCSSPMVIIKMINCPICNEPVAKIRLRSDHLPRGGAVTPVCKGSDSLGEVVSNEIICRHYLKEQENHKIREMPTKV